MLMVEWLELVRSDRAMVDAVQVRPCEGLTVPISPRRTRAAQTDSFREEVCWKRWMVMMGRRHERCLEP